MTYKPQVKRAEWNPQKSRRVITTSALADYFKVSRQTMTQRLKESKVDLRNVLSILDFVRKYPLE